MPSRRWRANRPPSTRHCSTTRSGHGRCASAARPTVGASFWRTRRCGCSSPAVSIFDPSSVRYENGVQGKPRLGPDLPSLEFNLYDSDGLGLVAVARDRSLRVDGEQVRDVPHVLSIAAARFSAAEREVLRPLPPAERRSAFFRCWTPEEAVIKAVGEGLGRALDSFDVDLAPGSTSVLRRSDGRPGDVAGWSLRDVTAPSGCGRRRCRRSARPASAPATVVDRRSHGAGRCARDSSLCRFGFQITIRGRQLETGARRGHLTAEETPRDRRSIARMPVLLRNALTAVAR
jgi:hypothetical protein